MKLKMAPNSLFAILLRSPWWISLALAAVVAALARLLLPERFAAAGMLGGFPFIVIAIVAAGRQWRRPSAARSARMLAQLEAMNPREFSAALQAAFQAQGHEVRPLDGGGAELELQKAGRRTLVALRRWKAASIGLGPLRELHEAQQRLGADASLYLAGGEPGEKASRYAAQMNIRLMSVTELLQLMHETGPTRRPG